MFQFYGIEQTLAYHFFRIVIYRLSLCFRTVNLFTYVLFIPFNGRVSICLK